MKGLFFLLFITLFVLPAQAKRIELTFWHAMAGQLGEEVQRLTYDFNKSQNQYTVKPLYKGSYIETLTSFTAAFRAHQAPAIVQVFEVGTGIMLASKGVIKPVDVVMAEQQMSLPKANFIDSIREFYSVNNRLMAMPFNLSIPVLYYNSDILAQLGYTKNNFPHTWDDLEIMAKKIKTAGYDCVYTTAYPGWILIESYLAIHGLALVQEDPMLSLINTPSFANYLHRLKHWNDSHYFRYGGRGDDATFLFTSGECPLFSQSSGAYNSLSKLVSFHLGVANMPLDTKTSSLRYPNAAGGAALWVVAGFDKRHYKGVAQFFAFIAKAETQKRWHEQTGYLPLGLKGIYSDIVKSSRHPILLLAQNDLNNNVKAKSFNHLGPQNQMRMIHDEILEALFSRLIDVNRALYELTQRSNYILSRFARNVSH